MMGTMLSKADAIHLRAVAKLGNAKSYEAAEVNKSQGYEQHIPPRDVLREQASKIWWQETRKCRNRSSHFRHHNLSYFNLWLYYGLNFFNFFNFTHKNSLQNFSSFSS